MKFNKTILALSLSAISINAHSAAFQLHETSASGLGRAFAGDAVIADDAAVIARNPAAMALFKEKTISVSATYVDPGVDIRGKGVPDIIAGTDPSTADHNSVVPSAVIPGFYFINPINDKFAYGVGMNVNFGLATEYPRSHPAGSIAGKTDLTTLNFNLSGSYRLNEQLSFGLGLNLIYGEAKLIRNAGDTGEKVFSPLLGPTPASTETANMEGDDINFGWNVGAVYELNADNRFGLSFRSQTEIDFEGDYKTDLPVPAGTGGTKYDGNLAIDMPWIAEFSGFHQLNQEFAVHYSVMYTDWSSFESIEAFSPTAPNADAAGSVLYKPENFDSTFRYAIGTTYTHNDHVTLRAGLAFDEAASNDHKSISIPDSDRLWYSAGMTVTLSDSATFDLGVSYVDGKQVTVNEEDAVLETLPAAAPIGNRDWEFESEGNAVLIAVQYNKRF